ncbi:hypothetical protein KBD20_04005 [Candidatus Saccharibacteria bacterium]|nr:hypothetical protein [Candidatus Saccharibacteria bacterium]
MTQPENNIPVNDVEMEARDKVLEPHTPTLLALFQELDIDVPLSDDGTPANWYTLYRTTEAARIGLETSLIELDTWQNEGDYDVEQIVGHVIKRTNCQKNLKSLNLQLQNLELLYGVLSTHWILSEERIPFQKAFDEEIGLAPTSPEEDHRFELRIKRNQIIRTPWLSTEQQMVLLDYLEANFGSAPLPDTVAEIQDGELRQLVRDDYYTQADTERRLRYSRAHAAIVQTLGDSYTSEESWPEYLSAIFWYTRRTQTHESEYPDEYGEELRSNCYKAGEALGIWQELTEAILRSIDSPEQ